tara:strand:+ start:962 stop:1885 length:924 start_codon:yes stop_codon:yes gene_type:complete
MTAPIRTRLAQAQENGSKAERAIAGYMTGALAEIPFETAASLARKIGVSEPTVGRFCRTIGYASFRDLKEHLKGDVGEHPWLISDRLAEFREDGFDGEPQLARGLDLEIAGLVAIYEQARGEDWARVVARLATTPRVYAAGFQTERGLAQYFVNQLQYLRDGVQLLDLAAGNFAELLASKENSCLVIFEARRYSSQAKKLTEAARTAQIPVTLVTDRFCDWGQGAADEVFAVVTQFNQFWDSTAQMASLGNLLINGVFMALGPDVEERLRKTARLYSRFTGHVDGPAKPAARQESSPQHNHRTEEPS